MAVVYRKQGKYDEALAMYEKDLSIKLKKLGDDHPSVADTYNNMAIVYDNQGKYDEALAMYEKALSIRLKKLGDDHPSVADTYNNMAKYTTIKASTRKRWQCTRRLCRSN